MTWKTLTRITKGATSALLSLMILNTQSFAASEQINWRHWEPEVFAQASAAKKMLMVNVGYEGCTACRYMDENTFKDRKVIDLLNEHFISIQVDSEARPDIGERYSDWAWPATAFLHPDGTQIFALRGSRRAEKFLPILNNLITRHANGTLKTDDRAPYGAVSKPTQEPLQEIRRQVRSQLDRSFDDQRGGWGTGAKVLEYPGPTLQLFMRGYFYEDKQSAARALKTARGFSLQTDKVWGGVFYASVKSWTNTIKEKRLETQAAALRIFADALQLTKDENYRHGIAEIDRYLLEHMRAPNDLFYSSQKDLNADLSNMDSDDYYRLDNAGRRAIAYPKTDHATYTDLNARISFAYVRAYQATGNALYLERAKTIMLALVETRLHNDGWFMQLNPDVSLEQDKRAHVLVTQPRPYLRTQTYVGLALLNLYQASDDTAWLDTMRRLAIAMEQNLEDPVIGGFFATNKVKGISESLAPRKPLEDNAAAASFFYLLGVLEKNQDYRDKADATIRAVAVPEIIAREGRITGNLAVVLELLINGYVEMSIVGEPDDPAAIALFNAAHQAYEPRKIVHYEKPGRYPAREKASLYICNDNACSLPITDANIVGLEAKKFTPSAFAN